MKEYKVWAFARSAAPNLPALEEQLAEVMREADRRGYIIVNSCMEQKCGTEFWRPDLFAILTAVQQGRVNAVMVQSLDRLSHDITTLYRILRFLQNYGAVLITTETNLQYELYLTGLERSDPGSYRANRKKSADGRWLSMQIDPFPVRLEQELKYALAYAALVSAAASGRLPRDICQRANVGYARKCSVLCRDV